jgi:hypothetical protein
LLPSVSQVVCVDSNHATSEFTAETNAGSNVRISGASTGCAMATEQNAELGDLSDYKSSRSGD